MRLKHIKLVGFKSFVDSTTVLLPTNLTAIVGPNGCGKSNIIDAVRWVMGESSAKQLRGESLGDVIFNGSSNRKPVGQAAIELTFDNSDQTLTGPYASYNEISLRREISREGQSTYFLNGAKCRRRDITDLFLGTGLGPRSYAIIEQGMISRLIEAKPEDLRNYIEEAAGISKYKERRHETELRIKHTNENLARLNDIRQELEKQLNHLQRQANAAEKYKVLKEEERLLKAQIYTIRWQLLNEQVTAHQTAIQEQETALAVLLNNQQELEKTLEEKRSGLSQLQAENNTVQDLYYQTNNEVNRTEQSIQALKEKREQWQQEFNTISQAHRDNQQLLVDVTELIKQLTAELSAITPQLDQAKAILEQSSEDLNTAEDSLQTWQKQWDEFNLQNAQTSQQLEVEQTRLQHLKQRLHVNQERLQRMDNEFRQQELVLGDIPQANFQERTDRLILERSELEQKLKNIFESIHHLREQQKTLQHELESHKNHQQNLREQLASLEAVQQVALGQREEVAMEWLKKSQIADLPRFAQLLEVDQGWEKAVEAVLGRYLQAVCMDNFSDFVSSLNDLPEANLSLLSTTHHLEVGSQVATTLLSKLKAPFGLDRLISGVYVAETLHEANRLVANLQKHESVITKEGVWIGHGWLYIAHKADAKTGVLNRERELLRLREELVESNNKLEQAHAALHQNKEALHVCEEQRDSLQQELNQLVALQAETNTQKQVHEAKVNQIQQRVAQINKDIDECKHQIQVDQEALAVSQELCQKAQIVLQQQAEQKEQLLLDKNQHQALLEEIKQKVQRDQNFSHQLALQLQATQLQFETAEKNKARLEQQKQELSQREVFLQKSLDESMSPLEEASARLNEFMEKQAQINDQLSQTKARLEETQNKLSELESSRQQIDRDALKQRDVLEQLRLSAQADTVRSKNLEEQLAESGFDLPRLIEELPAEVNETEWEEKLQQVVRKIERLGAINLAAIDEYTVQAERKEYLDKQNADLTEALTALEDAMQKMDKETKTRFKETYEQINTNFQNLFPTLFGGGRASLQIENEDLLEAGITVMAQPPGKRNSSIHLLSGGEKALTAIALVFSLFQLNPAPFCMLDEVDAPLDDANVGRFCNLVKHMSATVQFIFISHNKLAIEMAEQLAGVTMHEPGVSRMVSVNIEEAIAMAEA